MAATLKSPHSIPYAQTNNRTDLCSQLLPETEALAHGIRGRKELRRENARGEYTDGNKDRIRRSGAFQGTKRPPEQLHDGDNDDYCLLPHCTRSKVQPAANFELWFLVEQTVAW